MGDQVVIQRIVMNAEMDRTSEYGCLRVDCGRRVMRLLENCDMRPLRCAVDCFLSVMSRRAPSPSPSISSSLSVCASVLLLQPFTACLLVRKTCPD